jgi:hypothetical protein
LTLYNSDEASGEVIFGRVNRLGDARIWMPIVREILLPLASACLAHRMASGTARQFALRVTRRALGAMLAVAIAWVACQAALACPNCKDALARGDGSGGDLASGFSYSILFMMGMPFLLSGVVSLAMYRAVKKAQAAGWGSDPWSDRPVGGSLIGERT